MFLYLFIAISLRLGAKMTDNLQNKLKRTKPFILQAVCGCLLAFCTNVFAVYPPTNVGAATNLPGCLTALDIPATPYPISSGVGYVHYQAFFYPNKFSQLCPGSSYTLTASCVAQSGQPCGGPSGYCGWGITLNYCPNGGGACSSFASGAYYVGSQPANNYYISPITGVTLYSTSHGWQVPPNVLMFYIDVTIEGGNYTYASVSQCTLHVSTLQ